MIAGLTCATLLVLHRRAELEIKDEVKDQTGNVILTFQVMQQQHQISLSHTADLLATVASMRNGDVTTINDAGEDPWGSSDCDLLALADPSGHILAMHSTAGEFPIAVAEVMLRRSGHTRQASTWWYSGARLYQVAIQPFYNDPSNKIVSGVVIAGRGIGSQELNDLARISSTQVALRLGDNIVASTIPALKQAELADQLREQAAPEQVRIDEERYWGSLKVLSSGLNPPVSLIVLKSDREAMASLAQLNHMLLGLGLLAVFAGGALVFAICDAFTRPLGNLLGGVDALEKGDFEYRLESRGSDEVAQLTRAFGRMRSTLQANEAQRQKLEEHLRRSQKMEAIGRLAGGVAHDFNNLLTVIKGHAEMMLEQLQPGDALHSSGRQIEEAADRAASLTRQLLAFCRMQVLQPKVLNVNVLISDMAKMLTRLIRADVHFSFHPDDSLGRVKADSGQLEQVILNFTVNAVDAMPNGGTLRIETQNVAVDGEVARNRPGVPLGSYVMLAVTDTGCGMDAQTKARIFEPFFTTKEVGKGTGLGLATVYGVIKQSGGWIWVESEPSKGSRFEVYLPRVMEAEETVNGTAKTPVAAAQGETVMIAEDEDAVRDLASSFLKSAGYTVLSANNGGEALECAKRWGKPIHLLLTDMVMPQMRGSELARKLRRLYPDINTVYMSGYHDRGESDEHVEEEPLLLQKPFSRDNLLSVVAQALEGIMDEQAPPAIRAVATAVMKSPRRWARRNGRRMVV